MTKSGKRIGGSRLEPDKLRQAASTPAKRSWAEREDVNGFQTWQRECARSSESTDVVRQNRLGHVDLKTTYGHSISANERAVAEQLGQLFSQASEAAGYSKS